MRRSILFLGGLALLCLTNVVRAEVSITVDVVVVEKVSVAVVAEMAHKWERHWLIQL
jgi:hypothetical protein